MSFPLSHYQWAWNFVCTVECCWQSLWYSLMLVMIVALIVLHFSYMYLLQYLFSCVSFFSCRGFDRCWSWPSPRTFCVQSNFSTTFTLLCRLILKKWLVTSTYGFPTTCYFSSWMVCWIIFLLCIRRLCWYIFVDKLIYVESHLLRPCLAWVGMPSLLCHAN